MDQHMSDNVNIETRALFEDFRAELTALRASIQAAFKPVTARDNKTGPIQVVLDLRESSGRIHVEVWVKSSLAADFFVEGSSNGVDFRQMDVISLVGGGESHRGYLNAYPVLRVSTTSTGDNEIEIVAAR